MSDAASKKIEIPLTHILKVIKKPEEFDKLKTAGLGRDLINKRRHANKFKGWIIPEQPTGYIKAKRNEIL
jgi:hypothetical protein